MNLLVENPKIHQELLKRWDELGLTSNQIINDAQERGMSITASNISKYKKAVKRDKEGKIISMNFKGSFTQIQLVWLAFRYGIYVNINVGTLTVRDNKPLYIVEKFDELKALQRLKIVFPATK